MLILFLFFCSGATALVYEVIWSKYLALLFGSTIQAQTVVLAVFMGGLAIGNKLFGLRADRARRSLAVYGFIEVAIGLYAMFFTTFYRGIDVAYAWVGTKILDQTGWLLLWKGIISVLLLIGPTILMGGTLPVIAAWLKHSTPDAGRRSARFYSTNSLGAVFGAGLAGFFLVPDLGMPATLLLVGLFNVLFGSVAVYLGMKQAPFLEGGQDTRGTDKQPEEAIIQKPLLLWGCVLVALTGGISMGMEVLASRCLALIFGSSLQVFAIVLMAFILGIGLGSAVVASPRFRRIPGEVVTVFLLLAVAVFIGLLVFNIEHLIDLYRYGRSGLSRSTVGYRYYELLTSLASIVVLGMPAAGLGAVLPLWIRVFSGDSPLLGQCVGRLLTWNTMGAVVGSLLTGFVIMPSIGLRGAFAMMGLILAAAAIITAVAMRFRTGAILGFVVGLLLVVVASVGGDKWRYAFSSGVFRWHDTDETLKLKTDRIPYVNLLFYKDAADATVTIESEKSNPGFVSLRINGKPDASSRGDLPTQIYLGQIPMIIKPDGKDVFVFGFGSGITAATILGYPVEHMTIAENCDPVLEAAKFFDPWNHVVMTNSRVKIYREDARTVLKLSPRKYDIIFSEPSNPWTVGVGSVFSREFYRIAAKRLKPGGLFAQWFHTYEMEDKVIFLVLRTFAEAFPNMEIWDVGGGDIYLLGSDQPWKSAPEVFRRAFELTAPRADLAAVGFVAPEAVWTRQVASQRTAPAIAGPGPVQSDFRPILEYDAPEAFYIGRPARDLNRYDERTWQMDLAPLEKNQTLSCLDDGMLEGVFREPCPSWNDDVQRYVRLRMPGSTPARDTSILSIPCVFQGTNGLVLYIPESGKTNLIIQALCTSELILRTTLDPASVLPAIEQIKYLLENAPASSFDDPTRKADYFADLAVKNALHLGRTDLARAILLRGLELEPNSKWLHFLSRVMIRDGTITAAELPPIPEP